MKRASLGVLIALGVLCTAAGVATLGAAAMALGAPRAARALPAPPTPPAPPQHVELQFAQGADTAVADLDSATASRWIRGGNSGDMVRFGENIVVGAGQRVRGDVVAVGGSIDVLGTVDGDAVAVGGRVRVRPGGAVHGQAISVGGRVIHEGTGVMGGSQVSLPGVPWWLLNFNVMNMVGQGIKVIQLLLFLGLTLLLAWIASLVAPGRTLRSAAYLRERPAMALLWGLGAIVGIVPSAVAVAIVGAILCITIIGIPVAILLLLGYAVGLMVLLFWGYLVGACIVGAWVALRVRPADGVPGLWRSLLFGIVALFALGVLSAAFKSLGFMVPPATVIGVGLGVLNALVASVVMILGIGALLATRGGSEPRLAPGIVPGVPPAAPVVPVVPAVPAEPVAPVAPIAPPPVEASPSVSYAPPPGWMSPVTPPAPPEPVPPPSPQGAP